MYTTFCDLSIQAHDGPVLKVVWAPPEYGDVVVSSSTSGSVSLWEEVGQSKCFVYYLLAGNEIDVLCGLCF